MNTVNGKRVIKLLIVLIHVVFFQFQEFALQADILDEDKRLISAVDYYFLQEDGYRFKVSSAV